MQMHCQVWDEKHYDAPACFTTDVWLPTFWAAAHNAALAGRMRVLKWLVEDRGVPVHCLFPSRRR